LIFQICGFQISDSGVLAGKLLVLRQRMTVRQPRKYSTVGFCAFKGGFLIGSLLSSRSSLAEALRARSASDTIPMSFQIQIDRIALKICKGSFVESPRVWQEKWLRVVSQCVARLKLRKPQMLKPA
jgi:hypothetical protein